MSTFGIASCGWFLAILTSWSIGLIKLVSKANVFALGHISQ